MKDGLGQTITLYTIQKITEKRVKLDAGKYGDKTYVDPSDLVVVNKLLQ